MSREKQDSSEQTPGTQVKLPNHGAVLQTYSLELLKCIDEMRYKRDALHTEIKKDQAEKAKLEEDLKKLTDQLMKINETICDKMVARSRFDQCIEETEQAFQNLAVNSDNLVKFMKKVTANIAPQLAYMKKEEENSPRQEQKKKKGKEINQ